MTLCAICGQPVRKTRATYGTRTEPASTPYWQHVPALSKAKRQQAATHAAAVTKEER